MRGELSSGRFDKRHPLDWYVEPDWTTQQLIDAIGFREEKAASLPIWDPACGRGNIPLVFEGNGFNVLLSDIVDNVAREDFLNEPPFFGTDFLDLNPNLTHNGSIVCNPPYSYKKVQGVSISTLFIRQALAIATHRICMLLPLKYLASQSRYRLFMADHPPAAVLHLSQRPSMPPGDRIAAMGNRAFRGGMIDYCWIVWDKQARIRPGETRAIWLPPLVSGEAVA